MRIFTVYTDKTCQRPVHQLKQMSIIRSECFTFRLKRTTDVMFGGKQVLVCGYGEVNGPYIFLTNRLLIAIK